MCVTEGVYFNVLLTLIQTEIWEHGVPPPIFVMQGRFVKSHAGPQ